MLHGYGGGGASSACNTGCAVLMQTGAGPSSPVLRGVSCVTSYATFCRLDSLQDLDTPARVSYLDEGDRGIFPSLFQDPRFREDHPIGTLSSFFELFNERMKLVECTGSVKIYQGGKILRKLYLIKYLEKYSLCTPVSTYISPLFSVPRAVN